jgi:hypothetical protein
MAGAELVAKVPVHRLIILLADGRWYDLDMEAAEENIAIIEKLLNYGLIYPISGTGDM